MAEPELRIAPKSEQPKGGYLHPRHLLAYGPVHMEFRGGATVKSNKYCVAPSASIWDAKFLNE